MVESPMYERLMQLVAAIETASALDASDHEHNTVVCGLNEANNSTYHLRTNQGFTGETGDQVDEWTDRAMKQVQAIKDGHNTAMEFYAEARRVMKHVREDAMQLSPTLVDSKLQALADAAHVVIPVTGYMGIVGLPINAVATTGEAYVQGLIIQANNQREAAATDILQRANDTMQALADGTNAQRVAMENGKAGDAGVRGPKGPSSGTVRRDIERGYLNTSAHEAGVYPGSRDTDYGRSDLRGSGSGLYPAGYDEGGPVSDRVMSSPRIPNRFVTEGETGSRLNPISDPQDLMGVDLLHTRVNGDWHRNGVVGGYTPAPPVDRYHPLWNVNGGPGSESALTSRFGGAGMLGAGALGVGGAAAWREASARRRALLVAVLQVPSGEEARQVSAECLRCARGRTLVRATGPTRHPLVPQVYLVSSELMAPAGRVPVLVPLAPGKPELRELLDSWAAVLVRAPAVARVMRRRSVASTRLSAWRTTMSCRKGT